MLIPDRELAGAIKFTMKAMRELNLSDPHVSSSAVEKLGADLGLDVVQRLAVRGKDPYEALVEFWSGSGLGSMEVNRAEPVSIRLTNCYDCNGSNAGSGKMSCSFK